MWTNPFRTMLGMKESIGDYSEMELTEINPETGALEELTLGEFEEEEFNFEELGEDFEVQ